jgi:hypothetical protein
MIRVVERVVLPVPVETAWERLSDLAWLMNVNVFHRRVRFIGSQHRGAGAQAVVDHGLPLGLSVPRIVRVTHWDEGCRIRWTDVDANYPAYLFPHAEEFRLDPLGASTTLLTDRLTGTLYVHRGPLSRALDDAFAATVATWSVRRQCRLFRAELSRSGARRQQQPGRTSTAIVLAVRFASVILSRAKDRLEGR